MMWQRGASAWIAVGAEVLGWLVGVAFEVAVYWDAWPWALYLVGISIALAGVLGSRTIERWGYRRRANQVSADPGYRRRWEREERRRNQKRRRRH